MSQNESKVFMFNEMIEAMDKSIDNITHVISEQKLLVQIIKDSKYSKQFTEFIDANVKQIENLQSQLSELTDRKKKLEKVMSIVALDAPAKAMLELLIDALGLFKQ